MAGESNNWLSFSLSSMEMLNSSNSTDHHHHHQSDDMLHSSIKPFDASSSVDDSSAHYYSFADNFYATGWPPNQKSEHNMYNNFTSYMNPPPAPAPKLEDFFTGGGDSAETQDSTLTHMYEQQDLKTLTAFQAFSANSGSEVDDSGFVGQNHSPVESTVYSHCPITNTTNGCLSLGVNAVNNNNNLCSIENNNNSNKAIVAATATTVESESCKKIADTFGQRTSIYRGVTRHRWTGRYEAHLWDNSCRREGQARKGRQVYLGGYDKEEKAARSYDLAALKYWGPTATTNFPIANYSKEMEEMKHVTKQEFIASLRRKSSGFSRGASIYRGVTRHHQQGRWQARIGRVAGNKDLYLGTFATEEEAAEAYDIAAIKFRGINAVTNFEMNRYDVEAIAKSSLPIGGTAKRLKLSLESEEKLHSLQAPCNSNSSSSISFASIPPPTIPYGVPFDPRYSDTATPFYHQNLFHHFNTANPAAIPDTSAGPVPSLMPEFFIWPQSY